jgi:catechol 2,3-dioxygenase-like lactoylglutathione lyase family enzyme
MLAPQEAWMKLSLIYLPVKDLKAALALYRDTLGFEESWREGELTAGLALPGTDVQLMLDQDAPEGDKPGPFFQVDDVDAFYAEHQGDLAFVASPKDIPPGRYVAFDDPWGNRVHVLDMSAGG